MVPLKKCLYGWRFVVFAGLSIACTPASAAGLQRNSIKATVSNEFSRRVTVSIDGEFKCEVAANSNCSFQITKGKHVFVYRRDDGSSISSPNEIPSSYDELCIHLGEKGVSYDDCDTGFLGAMATGISIDSLVRSAKDKYAQKDYDGAIADATKAIGIDPNFGPPYVVRGDARSEKKDYDGAIADYTRALQVSTIFARELNPKLAGAYRNRGLARFSERDFAEAVSDFTKLIELKPDDAISYDYRGSAKLRNGDFESAITDYTRAIALNQDDDWAYTYRGESSLILGRADSAYRDSQKALELAYSKGQTIEPIKIIVCYFGLRGSNKTADAHAFLDLWAKRLNSTDWPTPIISYLRRELTEPQLLALATDERMMTDSHTFIGMEMALSGNRQAALMHLRWVRDKGDKTAFSYSVGESELRPLETTLPHKP